MHGADLNRILRLFLAHEYLSGRTIKSNGPGRSLKLGAHEALLVDDLNRATGSRT